MGKVHRLSERSTKCCEIFGKCGKLNYICIVFNQNIDIMDSKLDLKIDVLPTRKRTHKVHRNGESQKRFGHRNATTSKNKNKDVPINHGFHLEDYKRRVVYEHYYNGEKLPFYVGQGKLDRAFDFRPSKRNIEYNEKAKDINLIKVNIVAIDISKEEAENLEEKLIAKYKRKIDGGTLVNVTKRTSGGFKLCNCVTIYQFDKKGNYITSFQSIAQASRQTGINAINIWQCANGYSSYSHAGGYKWRYTKEFTNIENSKKVHYDYNSKNYKANKEKYRARRKELRKQAREAYLNSLNMVVKFN